MAMNKKLFITPIYLVLRLDIFSMDKYLSETHNNEYTSTIYKKIETEIHNRKNKFPANALTTINQGRKKETLCSLIEPDYQLPCT